LTKLLVTVDWSSWSGWSTRLFCRPGSEWMLRDSATPAPGTRWRKCAAVYAYRKHWRRYANRHARAVSAS